MADPVTSEKSSLTIGKGSNKKNIFTATKVIGPNGTPPTYTTEIVKYDDASGSNPRTIAKTDKNGKTEWTSNASKEDKRNKEVIKKASSQQTGTVTSNVTTNAAEKEALFKASGNKNLAQESNNKTDDAKTAAQEKTAKEGLGNALKDIESAKGTREDPGSFGIHVFPTSLRFGEGGQDFLKFDMMKYEPRDMTGDANSGMLGLQDRNIDRKTIGTVVLPIPGGIQDSQAVSWSKDNMDATQIALANIALTAITEGMGAGADAFTQNVGNVTNAGGDVGKAVATKIAGMAAGAGSLMTRTTGAVMNPNMELLFNSPSLRSFSFSFQLAPRDKKEAESVVKIIRFFKQGMAPIRSKSRLFLRSPHTFRLAYKHKGLDPRGGKTNSSATDHPFLNKFKECALNSFGVNYTPQGQYSTYEDGVMTSYQMSMGFQELTPVYNDDYGNDTFPNEIGF